MSRVRTPSPAPPPSPDDPRIVAARCRRAPGSGWSVGETAKIGAGPGHSGAVPSDRARRIVFVPVDRPAAQDPRGPTPMVRGGSSVPSARRFRHRAASLVAAIVLLTGLLPVAAGPAGRGRGPGADPSLPVRRRHGRHVRLDRHDRQGAQTFAAASTTAQRLQRHERLDRDDPARPRCGSPPTAASSSPRRAASSRSSTASADTTPTVFADLSTEVDNYWDRGLLGHDPRPELPGQPVRLRPVRPRRRSPAATRRAGTTPARPTRPEHRRLRRQRPARPPDVGGGGVSTGRARS